MLGCKRLLLMAAVISLWPAAPIIAAETWRMDQGQNWKAVSGKGEDKSAVADKYLLAVAEIKRLVNMGETKAVGKALSTLKKDFPEVTGPDLDAFIKAELLFSKGKFVKAMRSYNKFLDEYPESKFREAVLDREFAIGTAFLAGRKKTVLGLFRIRGYAEGEKIMERIVDRAGGAPIAEKAALAVAKSYEKRKRFNDAYAKWSEISSQWPTGQIGKDALLAMARCKHAAYRGPKYDGSSLVSAKSYYENFKLRYPKEAEEIDVDGKLKQINEQLAYKQFGIGQYYQQTGSKQAANFYYQMVTDNWPETVAGKMVKRIKVND